MVHFSSPVGEICIEAEGEHLTRVWIEGQRPGESIAESCEKTENLILDKAKAWLERYFAGEKPELTEFPLCVDDAPYGSDFAKCIWKLLCEIPYGEVVTYGDLAKKAAKLLSKERMSAQAVGGAVGRNPYAIVVPCHRVVGGNYNLTGYGGGLDKKIWLLSHEGIDVEKYHMPK